MESQTNQTNITVLGAASAPLSPSRPRVLLNTALALFIGALSGILLALVLELLNRRVRSRDDLPEALGLPLLGSVESARSTIKTIRQAGRP